MLFLGAEVTTNKPKPDPVPHPIQETVQMVVKSIAQASTVLTNLFGEASALGAKQLQHLAKDSNLVCLKASVTIKRQNVGGIELANTKPAPDITKTQSSSTTQINRGDNLHSVEVHSRLPRSTSSKSLPRFTPNGASSTKRCQTTSSRGTKSHFGHKFSPASSESCQHLEFGFSVSMTDYCNLREQGNGGPQFEGDDLLTHINQVKALVDQLTCFLLGINIGVDQTVIACF